MPTGFEVFVRHMPLPTVAEFHELVANPAWRFFVQQIMAKVQDIRMGSGFSEDPRVNDVNLLLSEGLAMVFELFNTFELYVTHEEDADETTART